MAGLKVICSRAVALISMAAVPHGSASEAAFVHGSQAGPVCKPTTRCSGRPLHSTTTSSYLDTLSVVKNTAAAFPEPETILRPLLSPTVRRKEKRALLSELSSLRRSRSADPSSYDKYVDALLDEIYSLGTLSAPPGLLSRASLPFPFAIPSYRICLELLRSTLDLTMPRADGGEDLSDARRQNLAVNLSQCAKYRGGVHSVYREARKRARSAPTMADMIGRTPEGLETPAYDVVYEGGEYELRRYAGYSVVSTVKPEDGTTAKGFQLLAGYIFGGNESNNKMAMTTPVFMKSLSGAAQGDATASGGGREMSFVLPSAYWSEGEVGGSPEPSPGADLARNFVAPELRAVVWFQGLTTPGTVREQEERLLRLIRSDDKLEMKEGASVVQASYNDPFTAPWKRRNELMVEVERVEA